MLSHWQDIRYLAAGTPRQQQAYDALHALQILPTLRRYNTVLAGTIPLAIDVATSDLDILCEAQDLPSFQAEVTNLFGQLAGFAVRASSDTNPASVVANFWFQGLEFEVFGQARPVHAQHAYRHMVVEHRLLELGGAAFRAAIVGLKQAGLKTEPAFARCLQLPGDPYEAMLQLEHLTDAELQARFLSPL